MVAFFEKYLMLHLLKILFLLGYYSDEVIIDTKHRFYTDEKLFELFFVKNDFAKYFVKCCNLFKYFVLHIMINL